MKWTFSKGGWKWQYKRNFSIYLSKPFLHKAERDIMIRTFHWLASISFTSSLKCDATRTSYVDCQRPPLNSVVWQRFRENVHLNYVYWGKLSTFESRWTKHLIRLLAAQHQKVLWLYFVCTHHGSFTIIDWLFEYDTEILYIIRYRLELRGLWTMILKWLTQIIVKLTYPKYQMPKCIEVIYH